MTRNRLTITTNCAPDIKLAATLAVKMLLDHHDKTKARRPNLTVIGKVGRECQSPTTLLDGDSAVSPS